MNSIKMIKAIELAEKYNLNVNVIKNNIQFGYNVINNMKKNKNNNDKRSLDCSDYKDKPTVVDCARCPFNINERNALYCLKYVILCGDEFYSISLGDVFNVVDVINRETHDAIVSTMKNILDELSVLNEKH